MLISRLSAPTELLSTAPIRAQTTRAAAATAQYIRRRLSRCLLTRATLPCSNKLRCLCLYQHQGDAHRGPRTCCHPRPRLLCAIRNLGLPHSLPVVAQAWLKLNPYQTRLARPKSRRKKRTLTMGHQASSARNRQSSLVHKKPRHLNSVPQKFAHPATPQRPASMRAAAEGCSSAYLIPCIDSD